MNLNDFIDTLQNNNTYGNYNLVAIADAFIFLLFSIAVLYLLIFALASLKKRYPSYPSADIQHRFIILYPVYKADTFITKTIAVFSEQEYPKELYDLVIVSNHIQDETIKELEKLSATVIVENIEKETKTGLIQYGISQLKRIDYDMIIILDSNNTVSSDFLQKINDAFYSGCQVVQTHRKSKDIQTDIEALTALSEEINNSIFRKGHVRLGFSSALISSGMAFDFKWFKMHIPLLNKNTFDKELEAMLFKEYIYIEYLEDVYTFDKKVGNSSDFYEQRRRWASNSSFRNKLWKLIKALINENWDYADKLFQWIMPSRMILMGLLFIFSGFIFIIDWVMAIKWFFLCFIMLMVMAISIPDKMINIRMKRAIILAPLLFLLSILGKFKRNK